MPAEVGVAVALATVETRTPVWPAPSVCSSSPSSHTKEALRNFWWSVEHSWEILDLTSSRSSIIIHRVFVEHLLYCWHHQGLGTWKWLWSQPSWSFHSREDSFHNVMSSMFWSRLVWDMRDCREVQSLGKVSCRSRSDGWLVWKHKQDPESNWLA